MLTSTFRVMLLVIAVLWPGHSSAQSYTFQSIDFPGATSTYAFGINNSGEIVGSYYDGIRSFAWKLDSGTFSVIPMPASTTNSQAHGINDSGQIVGVYSNESGHSGFLTDLAIFQTIARPGAFGTSARGITKLASSRHLVFPELQREQPHLMTSTPPGKLSVFTATAKTENTDL
jgi:uncharacterized membrane protein